MKLSVSKELRQAMTLGAVLGLASAIFDASASVVYGASFALVAVLVWVHLGPPEGHPLRYLRRR